MDKQGEINATGSFYDSQPVFRVILNNIRIELAKLLARIIKFCVSTCDGPQTDSRGAHQYERIDRRDTDETGRSEAFVIEKR
jgi:hypothetical protein